MKLNLFSIATRVLIAAAVAGSVPSSPPGRDLSNLTVPPDRLPAGCRLTVPPVRSLLGPQGHVELPTGVSPFPSNPWHGSDRPIAAAIRRLVDGSPPEADGPPLDAEATIAFALRWADDVVEAYGATYLEPGESSVGVYAVRFSDERLATPAPPPGTTIVAHGSATRVVLGPTVVRIVGARPGKCFQAISEYVRTLR